MTSPDAQAQVAALRGLLLATTDPAQRAALEAAIAALESAASQRSHNQSVSDQAQIGAAISGNVFGDVQTGGSRYSALLQMFFSAAGIVEPNEEQQELLTSYLDSILRKYDLLPFVRLIDLSQKRERVPAISLAQIYVSTASLNWKVIAESASEKEFADEVREGDPNTVPAERARRVVRKPIDDNRGLAAQNVVFQLERPLLLTEIISERRNIILLGNPGSGKSTFLRYLAIGLARAWRSNSPEVLDLPLWTAGLLLPIYVNLGGFSQWADSQRLQLNDQHLWQYILQHSEGYALQGLSTQIMRAYRGGRVLLLLDGIDEVGDTDQKIQVARAIAGLARPGSYAVVSCRARSFDSILKDVFLEWGDPVEIAPLSTGQIRVFVQRWYQQAVEQGFNTIDEANSRAAQLISALEHSNTLRELSRNPLLLAVITIIYFNRGVLPENRVDLYEDVVQLSLTRWTQSRREAGAPPTLLERLKQGGTLGGLRELHIRSLVQELAFRAHQSVNHLGDTEYLDRSVVRERLLGLFHQFDLGPGPANEKAELVLGYLEHESGLLVSVGDGRYGFLNKSLKEYLAACYLAEQSDGDQFLPLSYQLWRDDNERWREVIFLALGRLIRTSNKGAVASWIQYLLLPPDDVRQQDGIEHQKVALFAAECLFVLGGKTVLHSIVVGNRFG